MFRGNLFHGNLTILFISGVGEMGPDQSDGLLSLDRQGKMAIHIVTMVNFKPEVGMSTCYMEESTGHGFTPGLMTERSQTDQLCSASANGYLAGVKQCLQNGADVNGYNVHGRTPLQVVKLGCPAVALYLLESGADPNRPDPVHRLTILHDAARDGYLDMVQVLMSHGADANLVDDRGNLPVHLAAQEGHTGVVRLLVELTANLGLEDHEGHNA